MTAVDQIELISSIKFKKNPGIHKTIYNSAKFARSSCYSKVFLFETNIRYIPSNTASGITVLMYHKAGNSFHHIRYATRVWLLNLVMVLNVLYIQIVPRNSLNDPENRTLIHLKVLKAHLQLYIIRVIVLSIC